MELQKGDEDPAPSSPAASVTQSDFWDNLPNLAKFSKLLPASEHLCKHSSVRSKLFEVQCSHNRNLSAFAATIVNANTRPGSNLMVSFKIIIANIWLTFPL